MNVKRRGRFQCAWSVWITAVVTVGMCAGVAQASINSANASPDEAFYDDSVGNISASISIGSGAAAGVFTLTGTGDEYFATATSLLDLRDGTLTVNDEDLDGTVDHVGTLHTQGGSTFGEGVFLGDSGLVGGTALVQIDGGVWNSRDERFNAGYGATATINITAGLLNRSYLSGLGQEITLDLGVVDTTDARGQGIMNVSGGVVTGNVVVGAGGTGHLTVNGTGIMGSDVVGQNDFLTVGQGADALGDAAAGDATFTGNATSRYAYWTVGSGGGDGTLTVDGAGVTVDPGVSVRLGHDGGEGTLNVQNGADITVRSMGLTSATDALHSGGTSTFTLDNATVTVNEWVQTMAYEGGANSTHIQNGGTWNTQGDTFLGFRNSSVAVEVTEGTWHASDNVETASGGGNASVTLHAGATWRHDNSNAEAGEAVSLNTSAGDSGASSQSSQTTITLNSDARWNLDVGMTFARWGRTDITLNNTSQWDAAEGVQVATSTNSVANLTINDSALVWWHKRPASIGSGQFNVDLHGGTFRIGDGLNEGYFNAAWINSFTAGTLQVRRGDQAWDVGRLAGALPDLAAGMAVEAGQMAAADLPNMAGGTLHVDQLLVEHNPWVYQASGTTPGLTYDGIRLDTSGRLIVNGPYHIGDGGLNWVNGTLEVGGACSADRGDAAGYTDAYVLTSYMHLDLNGGAADFSDATAALAGGDSGGSGARLTLRNGATFTTAATDIARGSTVLIDGGTWTSGGAVRAFGNFMQSSLVHIDDGLWTSQSTVELGSATEWTSGKVQLAGGTWRAEQGYSIEYTAGFDYGVAVTGGTLIYGTPDNPLDFDFDTQLQEFTGGAVICYGVVHGPVIAPYGVRLGGSHFSGTVTVGGTFTPGFSPAASLIEGDFTVQQGGVLEMDIWGDRPGDEYDTLEVLGMTKLQAGSTLALRFDNYHATVDQTFGLFPGWDEVGGEPIGAFTGDIAFVDRPGYAGWLNYDTGVLTITEVPEPATLVLLAIGALGMGRRRRSHPAPNAGLLHVWGCGRR